MGSTVEIPPFMINRQDFQNPVGDQSGNWQDGMAKMLGATTGDAPQMGASPQVSGSQFGPTAMSGGANLGQTATYGGAKLDAAQHNLTFGQQQNLANMLGAQSAGQGPSLAQVTAKQQSEKQLADQMSVLASQRGSSNPALAQRAVQDAAAEASQVAAQNAVLGRTQEALGAQANLGSLLGQMNQEAQGFAGANAQLAQQAGLSNAAAINAANQAQANLTQNNQQFNAGNINQANQAQAGMYQQANLANQQAQMQQMAANLQAALQQGQINAQQYNQYMQLLQGQNLAQFQSQQAFNQLGVQQQLGIGNIRSGEAAGAAGSAGSAMAGVGSLLGAAALAFSDERVKTNIKSGDKQVEQFLNSLPAAFKLI